MIFEDGQTNRRMEKQRLLLWTLSGKLGVKNPIKCHNIFPNILLLYNNIFVAELEMDYSIYGVTNVRKLILLVIPQLYIVI